MYKYSMKAMIIAILKLNQIWMHFNCVRFKNVIKKECGTREEINKLG